VNAWLKATVWSLPFTVVQFVLDLFLGNLTSQTAPIEWPVVAFGTGFQFVAGTLAVRYMIRGRT
jgi:hypothetical protein